MPWVGLNLVGLGGSVRGHQFRTISGEGEQMTLYKDIEEKYGITDDNGTCSLCEVHEKAVEHFKEKSETGRFETFVECPWCGAFCDYLEMEPQIIGETNCGYPDEKIYSALWDTCRNCHEEFALLPERITHNANHGIRYTGGRNYLPATYEDNLVKRVSEAIRPNIEGYTKRILEGEALTAWNLSQWLSGTIEKLICEELYKRGVKK